MNRFNIEPSIIRGLLRSSDLLELDKHVFAMDIDGIKCLKTKLQSINRFNVVFYCYIYLKNRR